MTYWLLNTPFLAAAVLVLSASVAMRKAPKFRAVLVATLVMLLLTAIFDNAIIGFGIVAYDDSLISGWRIGIAPVEDFAYTLAAVVMVPALWHLLAPRRLEKTS
jgi:lycopene cyclase domain-containing protein